MNCSSKPRVMNRPEQVEPADGSESVRWPRGRDLWAAVGMLTALPVERPDIHSAAAAPATLFFPLVGGLIGLLLAGANWAVGDQLPAAASAVVLVALWEGLGRGIALQVGGSVSVSRGRRGGVPPLAGMLAIAALPIKVAVLAAAVAGRPAALLFAPMLARWAMVVLAVGARDAAAPSRKLNAGITFREFALTSVFTCTVVFTIAEAFGILLVVGVAALTLTLRLLQHRQPGGTSWPLLQASVELVEVLVLGIAGVAGRCRRRAQDPFP